MAKKKAKKEIKRSRWLNFNNILILLALIALITIIKTAFAPGQNPELSEERTRDLAGEANIVLDKLTDGQTEVSLIDSNELIEQKVTEFEQMDYDKIKEMLGIENDFCIFFEDVTGDLVKVDGMGSGIGSDKIHINGEPCK